MIRNYFLNCRDDSTREKQWTELVQFFLPLADSAEFNFLYRPLANEVQLEQVLPNIIWQHRVNSGLYPGYKAHYKLTDDVIKFIIGRTFEDWSNFFFEDVALVKGKVELLATITHEKYIVCLLDSKQLSTFESRGFDFTGWD